MSEVVFVKEERESPTPEPINFGENGARVSAEPSIELLQGTESVDQYDASNYATVKIEAVDETNEELLAELAGPLQNTLYPISTQPVGEIHDELLTKIKKEYNSDKAIYSNIIINEKYRCTDCGKVFKNSSNLHQHKKTHLLVKPFKCEQCDRTFAVKANLLKHQRNKTPCKRKVEEEDLHCPICQKEFKRKFLLKSHLRKHDTDRPYQCDICKLTFKYKSAVLRHILWHTNTRPYKCAYCPKRFTHSGLIKPHLRVHTGEKPYQCSICLKLFTYKHNMERHKMNHARIKQLVCDLCNKKFPRESRLRYHMKVHVGEKFFDCGICPKQFTHKSNVKRHYERKHPGQTWTGTETDASVAMKVWNEAREMLKPHYTEPEEILS